jgi:integrase
LLPGKYGSAESRVAFARLVLELASSPTAAISPPEVALSVNEVLLAYLGHAERYYADDGGKEVRCMKAAIKPVRELYGTTPATKFGPVALKSVRQWMIDAGLARGLINRRVDRIKRVYRWAAAEELVPVNTFEALRTLAGLRRGRTEAREREPVKPVAEEVVRSTLPHLPPHVRAMVELIWYTGMRPSEVCRLTLGQIDRAGPLWVYRPAAHKTAHHGKDRVIPFGPNARSVLVAFLKGRALNPEEPLFSPRRAREERFADMRATRRTKVQPSQLCRRKRAPKRAPGEWYTPEAVTRAVAIASKKAGVEHWHPYRIRHSFGTRVRKAHGLECAPVLLGHSHANVTEVYAERNVALALEVAAKIG